MVQDLTLNRTLTDVSAEENEHYTSVSNDNLDKTLDRLLSKAGYGLFQKKLLILCGFGWLADNMWLQTIAIILPRVQEHYNVSDKWIGLLSSSLFCGMTVGAFFWGTFSDTRGRKIPYTMTLAIASAFGLLSSFSFNFACLCFMLFFLGFGVGGNMPTDAALFLEFLPKEHQYLLTFMSVFFSFGAVFASMMGYIILPGWSCPKSSTEICDMGTQNKGWRILLFSASIVTLVMLALRTLLLKLPETPKFLISQGRQSETIIALQDIAKANGRSIYIDESELPSRLKDAILSNSGSSSTDRHYSIIDEDIDQHSFLLNKSDSQMSSLASISTPQNEFDDKTKGFLKTLTIMLSPRWRLTTILIWLIWTLTSAAFTMFNVFLPKYLETLGYGDDKTPTYKEIYWDYMIYSIAGVPGSIIASWLIETKLGRKGTMALSAFGSSLSLFIFSATSSRTMMLLSSSSVSFLATLFYAVIYGYTPEVFETNVRGTAVGTASGLGRIAGIITPVTSGFLLTINKTFPLYVSVFEFLIIGIFVILLPFETRKSPR